MVAVGSSGMWNCGSSVRVVGRDGEMDEEMELCGRKIGL